MELSYTKINKYSYVYTDGETTITLSRYAGDNYDTLTLVSPAGKGSGKINYISSLFEHQSDPDPEGYITMHGDPGSNTTGTTFKVTLEGDTLIIHTD